MILKQELLNTKKFYFSDETNVQVHGLYNPMQFVVKINKEVADILNNEEYGFNFQRVQAFSTYLHETIHWWQHVGSHVGFITSLSYPAIAHFSSSSFKSLIKENIKYKPLIKFDQIIYGKTRKAENTNINEILNNYFDTLYGNLFILNNRFIEDFSNDNRFFLTLGHCFHILWSNSISLLSSSFDQNFTFMPNINNWLFEFKQLELKKVNGFHFDSKIGISTLGTQAIFEGQAMFNQLQYLTIASDNKLKYNDFEEIGMLGDIYLEAFNLFLDITNFDCPDILTDSIIDIFLLVCDIAINPTNGFPLEVSSFENFITLNDPGIRFTMLCIEIGRNKEKWKKSIISHSKEEYISLSNEICGQILCIPPLEGSKEVTNWSKNNTNIKELLKEEEEMKYTQAHLPVRLFFSKYIKFQEDKKEFPDFFCWPGRKLAGEIISESNLNLDLVKKLYEKHKPLFVDEGNGFISATIFEGALEENIYNTFQAFYQYNTTYDMTLKWIEEPGKFEYNYEWLTEEHSPEELKKWIRENFKDVYDIYPEEIDKSENYKP